MKIYKIPSNEQIGLLSKVNEIQENIISLGSDFFDLSSIIYPLCEITQEGHVGYFPRVDEKNIIPVLPAKGNPSSLFFLYSNSAEIADSSNHSNIKLNLIYIQNIRKFDSKMTRNGLLEFSISKFLEKLNFRILNNYTDFVIFRNVEHILQDFSIESSYEMLYSPYIAFRIEFRVFFNHNC